MAYRIQLRRDTAANWTSANPTLAQGEAGYETDTGKLKIGNGTDQWADLDYFNSSGSGSNIDLSALDQSIIPDTDVTYDLGSPTNRFRDLYLSGNTIDLGGITLSNLDGSLIASAPIVSIAGVTVPSGNLDAITVTNGGSGYVSSPEVTIESPVSGITATASATVVGGSVTAISLIDSGSGYTSIPSVTVAAPEPTPNKVTVSLSSASGRNFGSGGDEITTNVYAYQVWIVLTDRPLTLVEAPAIENNFLGVWQTQLGSPYTPLSYGNIFTSLERWTGLSGSPYVGNIEFIDGVGYPKYLIGSAISNNEGEISSITSFTDEELYFNWADVNIESDESIVVRVGRANQFFAGDNSPDPDIYDPLPASIYWDSWFSPTVTDYNTPQPTVSVTFTAAAIAQGKNTLDSLSVDFPTVSATIDPDFNFDQTVSIIDKNSLNNTVIFQLQPRDDNNYSVETNYVVPVYTVQPNTISSTFVAGSTGVQATASAVLRFIDVRQPPNYNEILNLPTIPVDIGDLTDTEGLLSGGGFSGDYNDLINRPTIPEDISDLTDSQNLLGQGGAGPVQPYLELINIPFITQPAVLGEPVTVVAEPAGSGATFNVVIGAGPVIESVTVNSPGTGYAVGQNYDILYNNIGGNSTADNIRIEVGTVGEGGEILTLAAYIGAGGNTPGTYSTDNGDLDYVPSVFDAIDVDLTLTRDNQGALFNSALELQYDNNTHLSPLGTEWNADGWGTLLELGRRSYTTLRQALNNAVGNNIVGSELVMHDTANDKYYKFDFSAWGQSNAGGFAYTRTEVTDPNYYRKVNDVESADIIVPGSVAITRTDNTGIYNPFPEVGFSNATSPAGTTWNADGWDDLSNLTTRTYTNFDAAANGYNNVLGKKFVMYVESTDTYYAIEFTEWATDGGNNFAYVRKEIDQTKVNEGLRFADGTVLKSAEGVGRVKLESPGGRRIEEVHGYKQVSVTERLTTNYTSTSSQTSNGYELWVTRTAELDAVLEPSFNGNINAIFRLSYDNVVYREVWISAIEETQYRLYYQVDFGNTTPQTQGDTVFIEAITGGDPAVWWDRADLPGGSQDFRGAVIDYHAWTGESTIVGTVHIVRDSGEDHISHQEVASGSTDGENDDLWVVLSEGQISYRRIDGESKTLKVQWTAKVFYGSEFWD